MNRRPGFRSRRGMTLVELMMAMAVLLLGLAGLLAASLTALRQNSFAAKQNQATAVARDMVEALGRWDYQDARLVNDTANDTQLLESGPVPASTPGCVCELDLDAQSPPGVGVAAATPADSGALAADALDLNEDGQADFRRQASLAPVLADGVQVGLRISVVVSWQQDGLRRQVVLHAMKYDPAGNGAAVAGL